MSLGHSPRIVTDGMVLCLDAANPKNFNLTEVEVLVVAGGGGGGTGGGGGGAGGLIYNRNFSVTPGSAVTVTVGGGGSGTSIWGVAGNPGSNSVFGSLTAIGGGAGLHRAGATNSGTGGSGGGDAGGSGYTLSNATAGQGFSGGNSPKNGNTIEEPGGGGGGAGGPGENASTPTASDNATVRATAAGAGGPGLGFDISGTFTYYAGGGGGSNRNGVGKPGGIGGGGTGGASPTAGSPNTGGGGGGTGYSGYGGGGASAAGGSGIVIVRYLGPQKAIGGTVTSVGGHTIHTFTTVGSTTFTPLVATNNSAILGLSDLSGNGNFGTSGSGTNSPTYSTSNQGSIVFDGSNDYIDLNTNNIITGTNPFTFEAFYKITNDSVAAELFGNYGSGYTSNTIWISGRYGVYINTRVPYFQGAPLGLGTYHMAFTRTSAGACTLYKNGAIDGTATSTASISPGKNFRIGSDVNGILEVFGGELYCLKVYNRALTSAEISQNFNALRGRYGI